MLRRFMPRSLLWRSLLIIGTPLILVQIISLWVFYDRTRRRWFLQGRVE